MLRQFYTYLHCRPDGTPFYVGKGSGDRSNILKYSRSKYYLNILKKYGTDNIKIYVFYCDSEKEAFSDERQQIALLKKQGFHLANLTDGGEGTSGLKWNDEARINLSLARTGTSASNETKEILRAASPHRKLTAEHHEKLRIANTGRVPSIETREKLRQSRLGKPMSDEQKKKLSEVQKGKIIPIESIQRMRIGQKLRREREKATVSNH